MTEIPSWQSRLDWNKPQSPSNKERLMAAQQEIKDLRREIARLLKADMHKEVDRLNRLLLSAKGRAEHWRKVAYVNARKKVVK